jgi:hypothetical protein
MMRSFLLKVRSEPGIVQTMIPSTQNLSYFEALWILVRMRFDQTIGIVILITDLSIR